LGEFWNRDTRLSRALRSRPARGRRVRRTLRHIEPWSVLKIALLFHAALFLIICVASGLLWSAARASGTLDNVESFITSVGGFGNCEPIPGAESTTTTTIRVTTTEGEVDQLDPARSSSTLLGGQTEDTAISQSGPIDEDEDCRAGERLVGEFKFEDTRIFQAFALGGIVLVLVGTGATVVLVLLFNLMSDLVGGVEVTVIEEEPSPRGPRPTSGPAGGPQGRPQDPGSPRFPRRD
jgi:hypothetical protein